MPVALLAQDKPNVQLPTDYRGWTHVKSMVILPGHPLYDVSAGIHHIYANPAALEGYKSGSFPDRSIIVFDRLEAINADNAITEGKPQIIVVMQKDRSQFADTGGLRGLYRDPAVVMTIDLSFAVAKVALELS